MRVNAKRRGSRSLCSVFKIQGKDRLNKNILTVAGQLNSCMQMDDRTVRFRERHFQEHTWIESQARIRRYL